VLTWGRFAARERSRINFASEDNMSTATARSLSVGLVGLLLLLAWGHAEAQIPAASAEIARVSGQVSVLAKGQQSWTPATVGGRLVEGDQIRALAGSSADLNLPDGSTILVAENTRFAVTRLQYDPQTRDRNASFYVVAGKVRAQVSQAAVQLARQRRSNFTISTPSGVAAVRGTIVVVAHNPLTRETLVFALPSPGQLPSAARLTFVSRAGVQATLTGGQFLRVTPTGAPGSPQPISNLTPAGQASVTTPGNPATANLPDLTGFQVQIFQADTDLNLVQTATGAAVVAPVATTGLTGGSAPTGVSSPVGRDVANNPTAPAPCIPSSSTTCP
jgi:hypothetical protein